MLQTLRVLGIGNSVWGMSEKHPHQTPKAFAESRTTATHVVAVVLLLRPGVGQPGEGSAPEQPNEVLFWI